LVRFVNFAGVKVKSFISKVNAVSLRNAPLKNDPSRLVSMGVLVAVVAVAVVVRVNPIICTSYAPNSVPVAYMVF
jgi:hypothetical protein